MFHGFSLIKEAVEFEKCFYRIKLPFLYWWKADKNLQSRRSKLIEVLLRYISENRSDHYSYRNFAYLFAILEDEGTHFNNENAHTYLNDREREEIKQTNSYKKAYNLFCDFEVELDLSSTEFKNSLEASFVIHKNKTLFGSKIIFRIAHWLTSLAIFSQSWPMLLPGILILALHFSELRILLSSIFQLIDSTFLATIATFISFILILLVTLIAIRIFILFLPIYYVLVPLNGLGPPTSIGLVFDDITFNIIFYSSLIFYLFSICFLPNALRGKIMPRM